MLCRPALFAVAAFAVTVAAHAADGDLFPFVISFDAPDNATNVSDWLHRPAGKHGFVRVRDGRLVTDAGPIRFWATNLCFEACFPTHPQAERLAARLARLGINCVRMHHMDSASIWGDSPNKTIIDPKKLERLDYLIHQLKQRGVYTNINLHVSRWLAEAEGFGPREGRPDYDKGLGNFEPRMIELQKKYACDLLTHVNPYTKTSYAQEPAVAFVEISNEDALFAVWNGRELDGLPEPYATTFRELWNTWLGKKYGNTAELRKAWNAGQQPLGEELLVNGDFARPLAAPWNLERDADTVVETSIVPDGPDGRQALRMIVTRQGSVSWHPQLSQAGFALKKGSAYTLTCHLRSDKKRQIAVNCMMGHEPWERLGLDANLSLGPDWKPYQQTFVAERDDPNARITLTGLRPGTYDLAKASLRPGGVVGLADHERLEDQSVPVLRRGELHTTEGARHDFVDFLWDTERDYWWAVHRFLKNDLGVRPLVSGTQLSYSPVHVQAALDYIDTHAYWQHPEFPGRPWDPADWRVRNTALVNSPGGTLASLASHRVAGMAYTVSEYNHPAPNVYAAEGLPMMAAFGAFQSWDGIFSFTYSHGTDFEPRRVTSFFDIKGDPAKLVHLPACAALFLRGDAAPARQTIAVGLSREAEREKLHETLSAWTLTAGGLGVDTRLSLLHGMALAIGPSASRSARPDALPKDATTFISDTGELRWDISRAGAGYFIADTPRTKLFTGFVGGRSMDMGGVKLTLGKTRLDWATVSMVALDATGFDQPGRVLIALTGWVQNQDARLEQLGQDYVTLRNQWGSEPVLCEGVPAEVLLPLPAQRVQMYPLDEAGHRRAAVTVDDQNGRARLVLGPQHRTIWYEVLVR